MARSDAGRRKTLLCVAVLGLLPFLLFWRVALFQRVFADGDLYSYNFPLLCTIARQWKAGEIPLWNPYIFGGTPLLGNMQGGVFYPLNLLLLIGPEWKAYQYSILLHYSLAGVFAFLYLRTLSLGRTTSLYGATVFMLGGFGMGTLGHVSTLRTYPWLPLVLAAFEMWRRTRDRRHVVLAGASLGLMLVAGHPQIPLYAMMVSGAYAGYFIWRSEKHERARLAAGYFASFLLGVGLAAVQLLPTLQLAAQEYLRPSDRSYEYFVNFSLSPVLLLNLVFPRVLPTDESELGVYVGISSLVLVLFGAWRGASRYSAHRLFFSMTGAAALVLAFGKWSPLSRLLFTVPLYNLFTAPGRNLFEFDFCLAVLSALGLQAMLDSGDGVRQRRGAVLLFVLLASLAGLAVYQIRGLGVALETDLGVLGDEVWIREMVLGRLPIILASLAAVWFFPASERWRPPASLALWALLVADLASHGTGVYDLHPPAVYTSLPPVVAFLKAGAEQSRILTLEQPEDDREQARAMLSPDGNAVHGIESINGFDSMMLRQIDEASAHVMPTYGRIAGPKTYDREQFMRFMDLLSARLVLTPASRSLGLAAPRYRPVYEDDRVRVFQNEEALPRLSLVPGMKRVTRREALEALASGRLGGAPFDPRRVALVEAPSGDEGFAGGAPQERSHGGEDHGAESVTVLDGRSGLLRAHVRCRAPAVLVHAASYSRGWKAFVDGAPVPLLRAFGLVQAVVVPAGEHEIVLRYSPGSFKAGVALSALSVFVAIRACWPSFRKKARV